MFDNEKSALILQDLKAVEELFLAAAELPPEERSRLLDRACVGDPLLRGEVESLLRFDSAVSSPLARILEAGASSVLLDARMLGLRVGAYEITDILGHGGMGSVCLASRADDQFHRKVAVKFIRHGMDSTGAIGRFLRERQILAQLNHPYIAKLLDGGATEDGTPYFVMEYVEGTPIDQFCVGRSLSVDARCELFGKVCEAVAYAHRNLIVHRDLKPSNILVNPDGQPVLLDFGIAKILDESVPANPSATITTLLTPDYASPEQVSGLPTNTSTDVYSLGILLFQLLTGSKPFEFDSTKPLEMARRICEESPPRPSSFRGNNKLSGDLDVIVLMALRKEPERRYKSVDQFRDDILRYLQRRPVIAREDTFHYRAGKFVERNRAGVIAATLAAATLIGAVIATSHEASRANQSLRVAEAQRVRAEREHQAGNQQRERAIASEAVAIERAKEADAARASAQKRLIDMLDLSRHSLFEVQETLGHLAGALEARREIIASTMRYLDRLALEAADDPALLSMLVSGYTQTGDILGLPAKPNLGDPKGALDAWRKGRIFLTKLQSLAPAGKTDRDLLLQDLGFRQRVGILLESQGDTGAALKEYRGALAIAHTLAREFPHDPVAVVQTGMIEHNLGMTLEKLHDPSAVEHVQAEVRAYERVSVMNHANRESSLGLATAIGALARSLTVSHRLREGLEQFRRSLAIREKLAEQDPHEVLSQTGVASAHLRIAAVLASPWEENLNDIPAALESCRKALVIYEQLSAADPSNRKAKADLARALLYTGAIGRDPALLKRSVEILEALRADDPKQVTWRDELNRAKDYARRLAENPAPAAPATP